MSPPIYLDHNATAPLLPEAREAMAEALTRTWGNPSSVHAPGRAARAAVEAARLEVAALLGADREEIVFTSGGTEGDHLGIRGLAATAVNNGRGRHLVSSRLEHPAVLGALAALAREQDFAVSWVAAGPTGLVDVTELASVLRNETALVTLALANHELGNIADIAAMAALAHGSGALFHSDAVQAAAKLPIDVRALGVDALTISGHKLGGPKGIGALFLRRGLLPEPLLQGGHQEKERRAGTENVPGILGMAAACRRAREDLAARNAHLAALGARLQGRLLQIPGARLHGDPRQRLPGTVNVGFAGASGELVVIGLDLEGVAVSSGAACSSGTQAPSAVLLALGLPPEQAREAVRFSLGPENSEDEVDRAAALTAEVVARVRAAA